MSWICNGILGLNEIISSRTRLVLIILSSLNLTYSILVLIKMSIPNVGMMNTKKCAHKMMSENGSGYL